MYFSSECDYTMRFWKAVDLREKRNNERKEERRKKVQSLLDDPASTEGEKQAARKALARMS
jgi:hypothetical protein